MAPKKAWVFVRTSVGTHYVRCPHYEPALKIERVLFRAKNFNKGREKLKLFTALAAIWDDAEEFVGLQLCAQCLSYEKYLVSKPTE